VLSQPTIDGGCGGGDVLKQIRRAQYCAGGRGQASNEAGGRGQASSDGGGRGQRCIVIDSDERPDAPAYLKEQHDLKQQQDRHQDFSGRSPSSGRSRLRFVIVDSHARPGAFASASLALAACGTVNLELASAGVPQIALYKTSWLTGWIIRSWLKPTLRYATLPNIIAGRQLIPELLIEQCTPDRIAEEACFALSNPSLIAAEVKQLRRVVLPRMLARDAQEMPVPPSQAAARALLPYLPAPKNG
jgi:hypothetical protein